MARARQTMCQFGEGPHNLDDPVNQRWHVTPSGRKVRSCRPCALARERGYRKAERLRKATERAAATQLEWIGPVKITSYRRERIREKNGIKVPPGIRLQYRPSPQDYMIMQMFADGYSRYEIANAIGLSHRSVDMQMHLTRIKYGVHTTPEAIAQALKRGAIQPDKVRGKMVARQSNRVRAAIADLKLIVAGQCYVPRPNTPRYNKICEAFGAFSVPHAISIAWAAGRLTSRHIPQTANRYSRTMSKGGGIRWKN